MALCQPRQPGRWRWWLRSVLSSSCLSGPEPRRSLQCQSGRKGGSCVYWGYLEATHREELTGRKPHTSKYSRISTWLQVAIPFRHLNCLRWIPFIITIPEPPINLGEFIIFDWISLLATITWNSFLLTDAIFANCEQQCFLSSWRVWPFWLVVTVTNWRTFPHES